MFYKKPDFTVFHPENNKTPGLVLVRNAKFSIGTVTMGRIVHMHSEIKGARQ